MKGVLIIIVIFCALKANAQNFLISFAGTGASTTVSTVKVENLMTGISLILNADDILRLSVATNINSVQNRQSSEIKIYPNPMSDNSKLQFYPDVPGSAIISIFDMSGRIITQNQYYLENYPQEFILSGISCGLYFVNVKGISYQYSGKLFCISSTDGTVRLEKISSSQEVAKISKANYKGAQSTIDMAFNIGDSLKFTGISGIYSSIIVDSPTSDKTNTFNFVACTDGDGNNYPVVAIGTQIWMAENLKTTKYQNGDLIGTTTPATLDITSESTPKYQWAYDGNESNITTYGRLYTWFAVTDSRNVCPIGWHIPTDVEWTSLSTFLGGNTYAGSKLKEKGTIHWTSPNSDANNGSGFTALPGGYRSTSGGFSLIKDFGQWWTASEASGPSAWCRGMRYDSKSTSKVGLVKTSGYSVRCIKDN